MTNQPVGFEPRQGYDPGHAYGQQQPSWVARNGCWFFPLIGVFILAPIACCIGGIFFMWSFVSAPRDAALEIVRNDPQVVQELGQPIEAGSSVSLRNFSVQNGDGKGEITFDVKGPKGSATVEGSMIVKNNIWTAEILTVKTDSGLSIKIPEESDDNADGENDFDF